MTRYDDRPHPSDFPRVTPAHNCWRTGGVSCLRCELEEQAEEAGKCIDCGDDLHELPCEVAS